MKISACAISKNESKNVYEWFDNLKDCDEFYVLDTGSSDDTVNKLKSLGVVVNELKIDPFDFSFARNYATEIIKETDWIVSIDFDERIESGWRDKVEKIVSKNPEVNAITVVEGEGFNNLGLPNVDHKIKIYKKGSHIWNSPVHEHLVPTEITTSFNSDIYIEHRYSTTEEKENFYYSIAQKNIEKSGPNDWLVWFCFQYALKFNKTSDLIKYAKQYLEITKSKTTDFQIECMYHLSKNLNYEDGIIYVLKSFTDFPCEKTLERLIEFGIKHDSPETVLFASTLIKNNFAFELKKEAIKRLNFHQNSGK